MESREKRALKKTVKRMGWFIGIYFIFALFFAALLQIAGVPQWLNMIIIILVAGICYLLFWLVCGKIDKKREEKDQEKTKEFDPFAD